MGGCSHAQLITLVREKRGFMHDYPIFIFAALLIFTFGLFSKVLERSPVSAAMVFVSVGMISGPIGLGFLKEGITAPLCAPVIAEVTLVLVLFVDASTIDLRSLIRERGVPFRLLLIGLPLTMGLGFLSAVPLFENVSLWGLALMAFILSPTDAALGQPVLASPDIPKDIKEAINVESGLNDGIALPPILACIAVLASAAPEKLGAQYWVFFTLKQFLFGPLLGALVGWLGGRFVDRASSAGWMNPTFQRLTAWSPAGFGFWSAEIFHGNGFIAAFFGGLMLGTHTPAVRERMQEFGKRRSAACAFRLLDLRVGCSTGSVELLGWVRLGVRPHEPHRHPHAAGCRLSRGHPIEVAIHRSHRVVRTARNRLGAIPASSGQRSGLEGV